MDSTAIKFEVVHKSYNKVKALKGVSFNVEKGEIFGYLGPNGAGKTTTINALCGLGKIDSGKIRVFGFDVFKEYQKTRKMIGLAKQELAFDPYLKLKDIVLYQGGYFGIPKRELEDRAEKLIKAFELNPKEFVTWRKLSGGMKRRLELVKALIHDPEIIVLDEPTVGTDVKLRRMLWRYFKKLKNEGKTIFLTTHYIEEAEKLCDTICIINNGEIVEIDSKENLLKSKGKQKIIISFKKDSKKLPEKLGGFKYYYNKETKTLTVECLEAQTLLPSLISELNKIGLKIKSLDLIKGRLEDIYLNITGEDKGDLDF